MYIIDKVILHPGDKSAPTAGKFLKFGTVDAGLVPTHDGFPVTTIAGSSTKEFIGYGESDGRGYSLVCMCFGMRFYAAFLLPALRMPAYTFEYEDGEQGYGSGTFR